MEKKWNLYHAATAASLILWVLFFVLGNGLWAAAPREHTNGVFLALAVVCLAAFSVFEQKALRGGKIRKGRFALHAGVLLLLTFSPVVLGLVFA